MADEQKTIVFKVDLDNEDFIAAAAQTRRNVEQLKEEQKQLDRSTEEGARAYERYEAVIKQTQMEMRRLTDLQKAKIQFNKAEEGSNTKLRSALKILTASYNELSKEQRENTYEGRKLGEQIASITAELKANESAVGDNRRNVGNYTESIIEASNELKTASAFTDKNTKANLELSSQMEKSARSAAAIAGGFALLSQVVGENEAAQDALRKITIAVTAATVLSNLAKEKGAILDSIAFVKTKALTVAQGAYKAVIESSTVAVTALKFAIAGIGLAAAISLLTRFTKKTKEYADAADEAAKSARNMADAIDGIWDKRNEEAFDALVNAHEAEIAVVERRLKLREAEGATDLELSEISLQILQTRKRQLEEVKSQVLQGIIAEEHYSEAIKEELDVVNDIAIAQIKRNALLQEQAAEQARLNALFEEEGDKPVKVFTGVNDIIAESKALFEDLGLSYESVGDALVRVANEQTDALKTQMGEADAEAEGFFQNELERQAMLQEKFAQTATTMQEYGVQIGQIFAESMTDAGFEVEAFFRRLVALNIDILQRSLLTAIAEIYFREIASKGFAGIATGAALTALVVGATEAAKAALSKPVKFEHGGEYDPFGVDVGGRLHTHGGTKYYGEDGNVIELEKGEKMFVANRKTSSIIRAVAGLNQLMGGRGLSGASSFLADGGFASRQISDSVNSQFQSAQLAADIVRNLPEFRVSVTELNRVQGGVNNVKAVSTL